jgi:sugar lactone lactonase YvrE
MKKQVLLLLSIVFTLYTQAQTISTSVSGATFCSGSTLSVSYTASAVFTGGNVFTAQLSDAYGSFSSPVTIGTVTATTSGSISATIPTSAAGGSYRIRVISSTPAVTGSDNGANLLIKARPATPTLATSSGGCLGADSLTLTGAAGGAQIKWYDGASLVSTTTPSSSTFAPSTVAGGNGIGSASNQLDDNSGIYMDAAGNLYIADVGNHRIQKFPAGSTSADTAITVAGGNGAGFGATQLSAPTGVFVDAAGVIYVADQANHRIQQFPANSTSSTAGVTIAGGNGSGSASTQLIYPYNLYVDTAGTIYVVDNGNNRIQQFPAGSTSSTPGVTVAGGNGSGSAANQLNAPRSVTFDAAGNMYVGDNYNSRVQMFPAGSTSATNATTVAGGNGSGAALNQIAFAFGVYLDAAANLYVTDLNNHRVEKFPAGSTSSTNATIVAGGNGNGSNPDQFAYATGIYVDAAGSIYVSDQGNGRIQKWSAAAPSPYYTPTSAGSYTAVVTYAGCSSAASNAISINQPTTSSTSLGVCQSALPYSWHGLTFNAAGTQTAHLTNSHGCDSAATLVLTVNTPSTSSNSQTICQTSLPYSWNGLTFAAAGTQTAHLTNSGGCDSAATLILTVNPKPSPVLAQHGIDTLETTTAFVHYQWIMNNAPIVGDTNRTLIATHNGSFRVIVYDANGCFDTSAVINLTLVSISNIAGSGSVRLYPNPNNGSFILETSDAVGAELTVLDLLGRVVKEEIISSGKQQIIMNDISAGVYSLQIRGQQISSTLQFVISK